MTSSKPNHLPKAPPPSTITLGVRASTYDFEGDTYSIHTNNPTGEGILACLVPWNINVDHVSLDTIDVFE